MEIKGERETKEDSLMAPRTKRRSEYADANSLIIKCTARVLEEYLRECKAAENGSFTSHHSFKEINQITALLKDFKEIELNQFKEGSKMQAWLVKVSDMIPMLWD
jgi:hypothetical protein